MPPERGNSAASSAYVSAPHSVTPPPSTQASRNSGTSSTRCAIDAGVRKMPLPIVEPTTTATALHRPRRRGSRSPQRSSGAAEVGREADMRSGNIHFGPHDATLRAARLGRRRLHLPPHHPRRHRADHGIRNGLRRPLAAVQRTPAPPARPPHADRVRAPTSGCARDDPRRNDRGLRLVAATGNGTTVRRFVCGARSPHAASGARRGDREARAAAVDRDPPPRHRDATTRCAGRRRDGPARTPAAIAGRPRRRGGRGVGGAGARARVKIFPSPRALVRLWPRIRPHRWRLLVATVCLTASAAIGLAFPQIVRYLLDAAFVRHDGALLDRIALGLVGLFTIQALLNFSQAYLLSSAGERVVARLRQDLFEHLVRLSPGFFAERRTGELVSRLSADIGTLQGLVSYQLSEFARQVLYFLGGVTLLTLTHPELTRTTLLVVPFVVGAAVFFGRRLRKVSTGVQDRIAEATAVAEEAFTQIRTVQSFVQEAWEGARYGRKMSDVVRAAVRPALVRAVFVGVITFALFSGVAVVLWQGGRLVLAGVLTAGGAGSFLPLYCAA